MKLYVVFVIFFFGFCVSKKCPKNIQTITPYNRSYLDGIWYLRFRTSTKLYDGEKCVMQVYLLDSNDLYRLIDIYINDISNGIARHRNVSLQMTKGNDVGFITAKYPSDKTVTMHVVYYESETVSAIVACTESFGINYRSHAMILSRIEQPPEQQLQLAYQKLADYGFQRKTFVEGFSPDGCADPFTTVAPPP